MKGKEKNKHFSDVAKDTSVVQFGFLCKHFTSCELLIYERHLPKTPSVDFELCLLEIDSGDFIMRYRQDGWDSSVLAAGRRKTRFCGAQFNHAAYRSRAMKGWRACL